MLDCALFTEKPTVTRVSASGWHSYLDSVHFLSFISPTWTKLGQKLCTTSISMSNKVDQHLQGCIDQTMGNQTVLTLAFESINLHCSPRILASTDISFPRNVDFMF